MKVHRHLPRPATVIACLALLFSVSGSADAAVTASANSVRSSSIVNRSVQGLDVKENTLGSLVIRDDGVKRSDIADRAVGANQLDQTLLLTSTSPATTDADGTPGGGQFNVAKASVTCPEDTRLISHGAYWTNNSGMGTLDGRVYLQDQYLTDGGNTFNADGIVDFGAQGTIQLAVQATCLVGDVVLP